MLNCDTSLERLAAVVDYTRTRGTDTLLEDASDLIENLRRNNRVAMREIEYMRGEEDRLKEELEQLRNRNESLLEEIEYWTGELDRCQDGRDSIAAERDVLAADAECLEEELDACQRSRDRARLALDECLFYVEDNSALDASAREWLKSRILAACSVPFEDFLKAMGAKVGPRSHEQ